MSAYVVGGLVLGGIYAISVLGLVLTYTSSRVFNFAHGAIAYFLAVFFYWLDTQHGWDTLPAAVVTLAVAAPAVGFVLWLAIFRHLGSAPPTVRLVSTIGLWVAIPPLTIVLFGNEVRFTAPGLVHQPPHVYRLGSVSINGDQLAVLVTAVVVAVLLTLVLRFTPFGLSVRGTVDSPAMARLVGVNTNLVSAASWMVGTFLAGLAGVLLAPILTLDPNSFTLLLIASFAAVVFARMTSLALAFVGAIGLGLVQQVTVKWLPQGGILAGGFRQSIPFLLMAVCLLAYRNLARDRLVRSPVAAAEPASGPPPAGPVPRWRRAAPFLAVLAVVVALPLWLEGLWLAIIAYGLALSVVFLSYTVVTGEGGMISLCQITFAGIGAGAAAQLVQELGMSTLAAVFLGGLVAVPFGVLVAMPALRLGDLYLALATLAFAVLVDSLVFPNERFRNFGVGVAVPRPKVGPVGFDADTSFYYLLVAVFLVMALLVRNFRRSTTGLTLAAVRDSEPAAATLGISIVRAKVTAFAFSAFLAGLGGGLMAAYSRRATVVQFAALTGIVWLAVVVTWGVRSVVGALLAGISFAVLPELISQHLTSTGNWIFLPPILFGLGAVGLAREPRGVVFQMTQTGQRLRRLVRPRRGPATAPAGARP